MKMGTIAVAAGALVAVAGSANAAAFLTFLDPAGGREVHYTAPAGPGLLGTVTASATVSLQVDLTDHGLGVVVYNGLTYTKTAKVGPANPGPGGSYTAEVYDCEFTYTDGANLVLAGAFGTGSYGAAGGDLFINGLSGSISSNADLLGGSLQYVFGGSLIQPGNPGAGSSLPQYLHDATIDVDGFFLAFGAAIDGNWTLTGITPRPGLFESGGEQFLQSFDANAAFSGTVDIVRVPTPGTAALAAAGLLVGLPRSRRRA